MNKQAYQLMTSSLVAGLMLIMSVVEPVAAQSTAGMDQGSGQNQSQTQNGQTQDQNQSNTQINPCLSSGQNAGQNTNQTSTMNGTSQDMNQSSWIGSGADNAGAPLDCWVALNAHQSHWYKFRYGYNADQDDTPNPATVKLAMNTPGCISFEVWTPERLKASQNGQMEDDKPVGPVGAGSPEYAAVVRDSTSNQNQNPAKLIWVGSQASATTFYVVVKNRHDYACNYQLSISGFSVSFPSNSNMMNTNNATPSGHMPSNSSSSNSGSNNG